MQKTRALAALSMDLDRASQWVSDALNSKYIMPPYHRKIEITCPKAAVNTLLFRALSRGLWGETATCTQVAQGSQPAPAVRSMVQWMNYQPQVFLWATLNVYGMFGHPH